MQSRISSSANLYNVFIKLAALECDTHQVQSSILHAYQVSTDAPASEPGRNEHQKTHHVEEAAKVSAAQEYVYHKGRRPKPSYETFRLISALSCIQRAPSSFAKNMDISGNHIPFFQLLFFVPREVRPRSESIRCEVREAAACFR